MKIQNMNLVLHIPIFIFFLFSNPIHAVDEKQTGPEVIEKACSRAPDKNLCHAVFKTNEETPIMDLQALAYFALQSFSTNTSEAILHIKMLLDDKTQQAPVVQGLQICSAAYVDVVGLIEDSGNAIVSKAYGDAQTWLKVAINDVQKCDDSVKGKSEKGDEVSKRNQEVSLLCQNALSVVEVLLEK